MNVRRTRIAILVILLLGILIPRVVLARSYGPHTGYISTTIGERELIVEDMIVILPPDDGPMLKDRIFNKKLSREFTDRYEQKFGRTEQQRAYYAPNQMTYYNDLFGFSGTEEETDAEKRRFGEFMMKRLLEYHVENYAKTDPKARVVWEAKEKLSAVNLKVGSKMKIDVRYQIASNSADLIFNNPWLQTKITLQMGGRLFEETIVSVSRGITSTISAESHWSITDGIMTLVARKSLTPMLGTSLTTSTFTNETGKSRRESLYLAGVNYTY